MGLAGSTSKKVVAYRFDRETVQGFINPQNHLGAEGIEIITSSGEVVVLAYTQVKALCFVRDFDSSLSWKTHRAFANRPKTPGLWVRLLFRDGDTLEALISNDLLLMEARGINVAPPDAGLQNKTFIPREAVSHVEVLGVVGSPLRRSPRQKPAEREQLKMFE